MFKKIKDFLFGKPAAPVAGEATKGNDASWAEAKEVADVLKAVAAKKEAIVEVETNLTIAPKPTKKKRTYVKREPKVETPAQWPFPVEKPSEGVTAAELEALKVDPITFEKLETEKPQPAAMKVKKKRAAFVPKQD